MLLFLVRHGDSPFTAINDHQRPLSELGQRQALQAGEFVRKVNQGLTKIVCSDALRTRTTAAVIENILIHSTSTAFNHLYHARVGDWCDVIQDNSDFETLILVGHNPTMSYLAKYLQPLQPKNFSPACVAHYALEIAEDGLRLPAHLIDFFKPNAK